MTDLNRRSFLKQVALTGAGLQAALLSTGRANASKAPKISIAKYRTSPAESDGVAEEATRLTRRVIKDLGGMWVEIDASSNKARDNFYFNRTSGEAVCSFDEWQGQLQLTVPMPGGAPSMNSVGGGR